ncbi:histidine--tRNA ligase [Haloferax mediterranei ATCC 33500]|uniref:Histidine--tRNA ligase n=1 Tax=Haloferax mediterranei (strain ATCC 33500 / DSM 1411 / JCM 8866 / NBRC 14739 / NCIMB 2177 / R-4) TaxID=523841 RepID=I3R5X3_HALMT|nr:histidine--tRNA ligase [Haloferax mediterranei]AFK19633.1 histidyl-tRNA synthetase [Haloferax mediterranei ATCC 33500]AHZ23021.1 histidyl-tRNA synthetase [Haloferax mediterranei ATCC 33500]ELZ99950.1 histidyl-tRNA ligase [Haloferax mediterranei ATCC 33500]MDX5987628.1 histidine--tRNA ligase [Haloferax mediterranei ATCC 33500]QCQ74115.1 histidine--tRNA ligase [Haloferax mediterranei ATCC 33500]
MYDRLKGFRDFYPGEMSARREVIDTVETAAAQYGFREIGTPYLERTQMYVDKSGEEIVEELYAFEDKGGREVTLTPELTPTVARMVVAKQQALSKPIKWVSTRPFWRYEQVQQGRFREFYQTNADIFGSSEPEADAEILAFAADALTDLGLTADDFEFRVSHRDILGGLLRSFDADVHVTDAIRAVDKSEKVEREEYLGLLSDAGLTYDQASEFADLLERGDLDEIADFGGENVEAAVENLRNVLAAAEDFGAGEYCEVSLTTARGLDYYTGVVFECFDSTGDVSRATFGGGRYDDLIESFGGQPTPAVGVGIGNATLQLLCQRAGVWPEEELTTDYYVLTVGDTRSVASRIARDLREAGNVVEVDVSDRSFGAQMSYADSVNASTVVIVGERDLENGEVTVKDMESGEQTTAPVDDFPGGRDEPTSDDFE